MKGGGGQGKSSGLQVAFASNLKLKFVHILPKLGEIIVACVTHRWSQEASGRIQFNSIFHPICVIKITLNAGFLWKFIFGVVQYSIYTNVCKYSILCVWM